MLDPIALPVVAEPVSASADHTVLLACVFLLGTLVVIKLILIVILIRHLFVRTIPSLITTFEATNAEERRVCSEQFTLISAALGGLTTALQKDRAVLSADIKDHMTDQMGKYRHDIYDMIHAAVLRREVQEIKREREASQSHRPALGSEVDPNV